jgi:hypothetical protein
MPTRSVEKVAPRRAMPSATRRVPSHRPLVAYQLADSLFDDTRRASLMRPAHSTPPHGVPTRNHSSQLLAARSASQWHVAGSREECEPRQPDAKCPLDSRSETVAQVQTDNRSPALSVAPGKVAKNYDCEGLRSTSTEDLTFQRAAGQDSDQLEDFRGESTDRGESQVRPRETWSHRGFRQLSSLRQLPGHLQVVV